MNIPKNAGKPFTDADDQIIREMHAERASVREIAAKLERTEPGIAGRLERLGLRAPGKVTRKQAAFLGHLVEPEELAERSAPDAPSSFERGGDCSHSCTFKAEAESADAAEEVEDIHAPGKTRLVTTERSAQ